MTVNLDYLLSNLAKTIKLPVRLYENKRLTTIFFNAHKLDKDPIEPFLDKILSLFNEVTYFFTPSFYYYAIINFDGKKIAIGPTSEVPQKREEVIHLLKMMNLNPEDNDSLITTLLSLPSYKTQDLNNAISMLMYMLKGEEFNPSEIIIDDSNILDGTSLSSPNTFQIDGDLNNFEYENLMLSLVSSGEEEKLKSIFTSFFNLIPVQFSKDHLRHLKDVFIIATTLVSRAAIRGGMNSEEAHHIATQYIQHVEMLSDETSINTLQYQMVFNFAHKVYLLKNSEDLSRLIIEVKNYIQLHIYEDLRVEKIAENFKINRSYLSTKFKSETNQTLIDYMLSEKINKAKYLLRYSKRSLASIASYLCFSSQSHFQNTFKKYVGMTPKQFRNAPYSEQNKDK